MLSKAEKKMVMAGRGGETKNSFSSYCKNYDNMLVVGEKGDSNVMRQHEILRKRKESGFNQGGKTDPS